MVDRTAVDHEISPGKVFRTVGLFADARSDVTAFTVMGLSSAQPIRCLSQPRVSSPPVSILSIASNAPTLRLVPSYGGGSLNNQKYNAHLKEVGKLAGMTGDWITEKQSGRTKTWEVRPKYELLTSHVARRTFVTMCLRKGMSPEDIRAVTGHTTADMMMKYVKFDDESKREKMSILNENAQSGVEIIFDHAITDDERIRLGLPTRETYLEIFEGDTASVNAHLAVLAHIRGNLKARADYIKRLHADKLNEVLEIIMKGEI